MIFPIRSAAAWASRSPTWAYRSVIVGSACPSVFATVDKAVPRATAWLGNGRSEAAPHLDKHGSLPRAAGALKVPP